MTALATWAEIATHLLATYPEGAQRSEKLVGVTVRIDADGLTAHAVEVRALDVGGTSWVEVRGMIGPMRLARQTTLLQRNATGAIGIRCIARGDLAMRQTLPMTGLLAATLDEVVRAIAYQCADGVRRLRDAEA